MNIKDIKLLNMKELKTIEYKQFMNLRYNNDLVIDYKITKIAINDLIKNKSNFYQINKILSLEQKEKQQLLLDLIK